MLRCRLLGHRPRFEAEGSLMHWHCARGCGAGEEKRYPTPEDAARYAAAFNRDDRDQLGSKAPLGAFPLRIWRALRRR